MKNGVDKALTAVSVLAGLALIGAFLAGLMASPEQPAVREESVPVETGVNPEAEPAVLPAEDADAAPSVRTTDRDAPPSAAPLADPSRFEGTARVEVLNGAGRAGFARDATTRLRELGHDVVLYGNADRFDYASSVVLDRGGPPGAARAVAEALGIEAVRVEPAPDLSLDATVILGVDWKLPAPAPAPESGFRGFLRRLLDRG